MTDSTTDRSSSDRSSPGSLASERRAPTATDRMPLARIAIASPCLVMFHK